MDSIEFALDPVGDTRRGLERHLFRELVVIAVVALEAVIACEIALQCREDGDIQLRRIARNLMEIAIEGVAVVFAAGREESVLYELIESRSGFEIERAGIDFRIEKRRDVRRHNCLRVGQGVHEKYVVTLEGHTKVEDRSFHTTWLGFCL